MVLTLAFISTHLPPKRGERGKGGGSTTGGQGWSPELSVVKSTEALKLPERLRILVMAFLIWAPIANTIAGKNANHAAFERGSGDDLEAT